MKLLIIGSINISEITQQNPDKVISTYSGDKLTVDEVRSIENHSQLLIIIETADRMNRSCVAALLKIVEEGKSSFIFQANTIMKMNAALASRCIKQYSTQIKTQLPELTSNEKAIVDNILGKGTLSRKDIYSDRIAYKNIMVTVTQIYGNKKNYNDIERKIWTKIEQIILHPYYKANLYTVYSLMEY